jgi:3'-phosphoadenosine 5'-phosphosulfate sulfotransferase (PAPS reductase)/FAD synthetase
MATMSDALESLSDSSLRHIVSVSGGKDSAALAIYMRRMYPQLLVEYVFCDTGCELEETYDYLERLESLLGTKVKRLTALETLRVQIKPGRNPFDIWLKEIYGGFLPNPRCRWCTRVLKIEPFEAYVGTGHAFSYIGIRSDEDRDGYTAKKPPVISHRPNIVPVYPFKDDGITLVDVKQILEESGLGMPKYYQWRSRSGCYFCFYQQIGEWQGLKERYPERFEMAKKYEKIVNGQRYTWVDGRSLDEIANLPRRQPLPSLDGTDGCAVCHL